MDDDRAPGDEFLSSLIREIEGGLPLVSRPYAEIAERLGVGEATVIRAIERLKEDGDIKRLGVIVRHRELGYQANAMVVWDVPDALVDGIGRRFGDVPFVTLCYRRPRRPPDWPYNLFTMIHGRDRAHVLDMVDLLRDMCPDLPMIHEILFSGRRFKQRGARYARAADARHSEYGVPLGARPGETVRCSD